MSNRSFGRKILDVATLGVTRELPFGKTERGQYIQDLCNLNGEENQKYVFEHLYMNLSVLDEKTGSMLQFMSILLAIYSAMVGYFLVPPAHAHVSSILVLLLYVGVAFSVGAVGLFLTVIRVHWSHREISQFHEHANNLIIRRNRRTMRYRAGWRFSVLALAILLYILYLTIRLYNMPLPF